MPLEGPIQVLVVDDHPAIRHGIACLINAEQPRMSTVGAAATAQEAITLAHERQPNVVVLDVDLAGDDGLALIPVLQSLAQCEIVILTSLTDPWVTERARRLGAYACLNKAARATELVTSIYEAHRTRARTLPR